MFNLDIHFHKWVNDSQGAIYCNRCRKFKGWKPGTITKSYLASVGMLDTGPGYLLNGEDWKKKKEEEIRRNYGLYI